MKYSVLLYLNSKCCINTPVDGIDYITYKMLNNIPKWQSLSFERGLTLIENMLIKVLNQVV